MRKRFVAFAMAVVMAVPSMAFGGAYAFAEGEETVEPEPGLHVNIETTTDGWINANTGGITAEYIRTEGEVAPTIYYRVADSMDELDPGNIYDSFPEGYRCLAEGCDVTEDTEEAIQEHIANEHPAPEYQEENIEQDGITTTVFVCQAEGCDITEDTEEAIQEHIANEHPAPGYEHYDAVVRMNVNDWLEYQGEIPDSPRSYIVFCAVRDGVVVDMVEPRAYRKDTHAPEAPEVPKVKIWGLGKVDAPFVTKVNGKFSPVGATSSGKNVSDYWMHFSIPSLNDVNNDVNRVELTAGRSSMTIDLSTSDAVTAAADKYQIGGRNNQYYYVLLSDFDDPELTRADLDSLVWSITVFDDAGNSTSIGNIPEEAINDKTAPIITVTINGTDNISSVYNEPCTLSIEVEEENLIEASIECNDEALADSEWDEVFETREVLDENGTPVLDENGDPITESVTVHKYPEIHVGKSGEYTYTIKCRDMASLSAERTITFYVDVDKPLICGFSFNSEDINEDFSGEGYGYFFNEETEVRVYVSDLGVDNSSTFSSGISEVQLFLDPSDDAVIPEGWIVDTDTGSITIPCSELSVNNGGVQYASFIIPAGYKGDVSAEVIDNVGWTSEVVSSNGLIVEDSVMHSDVNAVTISAEPPKNADGEIIRDAEGNYLYNNIDIPVTVTVTDPFSGISTINWSISQDRATGSVSVDNRGSIDGTVTEASAIHDRNLLTEVEVPLSLNANANGNEVSVNFEDNAGNTSSTTAVYSIDTTVPTITSAISGQPLNDNYYNADQTVNFSITERNFDPADVVIKVNGQQISAEDITWGENAARGIYADDTVHTGSFVISGDGVYSYTIDYTDLAGNAAAQNTSAEFVIDKTAPAITNNFASFGSVGDTEIYVNEEQTATITVVEHNFVAEDMNVVVYSSEPGSAHTGDGMQEYMRPTAWSDNGDTHTLDIPFIGDAVYRVEMTPVDRAGNEAVYANGSIPASAVFEIDTVAPIVVARNGHSVPSTDTEFIDVYDFERRDDAAPNVEFDDINFDHIEYSLTTYAPVFENGREIGVVEPETSGNDAYTERVLSIEDFDADGIYAIEITAYDKAGNASEINSSTYMHMVDQEVLAYIENSNVQARTGLYSFEHEDGSPISKRPDDFDDISIVVITKSDAETDIVLRDENENDTSTGLQPGSTDEVYGAVIDRYMLRGNYFAEHYTEDTDTRLYLRVDTAGASIELGEMYIDNTVPGCDIPEHFKNWGLFLGAGTQVIDFENVTEELDMVNTCAYVDGERVELQLSDDGSTLSLPLKPGSYSVGLTLTDMAGNAYNVPEVNHLGVGMGRLIAILGCAVGVVVIAGVVVGVSRKKRREAV